jgi:hypothetical protein
MSRLVQGLTRPPIQWVLGSLSLEVTQPVYETGHSWPSSADKKNAWYICICVHYPICFHVMHRDKFTFCVWHLCCDGDKDQCISHRVVFLRQIMSLKYQNTTLLTNFCTLHRAYGITHWFQLWCVLSCTDAIFRKFSHNVIFFSAVLWSDLISSAEGL